MKNTFIKLLIVSLIMLAAADLPARRRKVIREDKPSNPVSIQINIPAYRLDLYQNNVLKKSYLVGVGMPGFQTSRRDFSLRTVQWNPWWSPPDSPWAEGAHPTAPGPKNPLGPVKMVLGAGYLIHGTNKPESIGHTASHGCIRMFPDEAIDLAWNITNLTSTSTSVKNPYEYFALKGSPMVILRESVHVGIVYQRIEVRDGKLFLHPDPYRKQPLNVQVVQNALVQNGYAADAIPEKDIELMIGITSHGTIYKTIDPAKK